MSAPAILPATDRFSLVIDALCRAVAARIAARVMTGTLIILIWRRLRRIDARVQALVAALRSGKVPVVRAARRGGSRRTPAQPSLRLPRGVGWLLPLVPGDAVCYAGQLRAVLADPEMAALIARAPQLVRTLRPLCRMLDLELPAVSVTPDAPGPARAKLSGGPVAFWVGSDDRQGDMWGGTWIRSAIFSSA